MGVFLFGEVRVFHRPHPSPDTDKGAVASNGGADFYAESVHDLIEEGRKSVAVYLEMCGKRASSRAGNSPASSMSASIPKIMPQRSLPPQQRARA